VSSCLATRPAVGMALVRRRALPPKLSKSSTRDINAVVTEPNMKARLVGLGLQPMSLTSAEFGKFIADQTDKWAKVIRAANIKPE
jgi:tripartite-type tricarboxylate transporter receptor subunit TctC